MADDHRTISPGRAVIALRRTGWAGSPPGPSARTRRPDRRRRAVIAAVAGAALVLPALSGCAVAARVLTAVELLEAMGEFADRASDGTRGASSMHEQPIATVTGTGGEGLRLNDRPGGDRIDALPDGTLVDVLCRVDGPERNGPFGPTTEWLQVRVPDGRSGYMSSAFLDRPPTEVTVYSCSTPGAVG